MDSISIYKVRGYYTNVAESGPSLASSSSVDEGPPHPTATPPAESPEWNLGLGAGIKNCARYSSGFDDYKQAFASLRLKPPVVTPNGKEVLIVDARPLGQRIGEFTGHMVKGVSKAAMTGIFATGAVAVIGGAISNYRWPEGIFKISDFGPFHLASRHLAKGLLELAKCVHHLGRSLGKAMVHGIFAVGKVIASHPMVVFKMAGVGMVGSLTFRQIALAGIEENYTRKAYHLSLAALGAFATLWLSIV